MRYVGLDVHWRTSTVCILDCNGREVKTSTVGGGWEKMLAWLDRQMAEERYAICYEASCGYGALWDRLQRRAARVVVAHPGQVRLIFRAKRKSDRVDARKLAKLLYLEVVPPVWVPSEEVRSWRQLIETRRRLVAKRTQVKNGLRSLLRSHGIRAPRGLWGKKGLAWLREVAWPTCGAALQRELLLGQLDLLEGQVRRLTEVLDGIGSRHAGVRLLRTIPGVGPRTAEAVVAYVDAPDRFAHSRQVGAYFGVVPRQDQSAAVNRLGHITKEGPASVRQLVIEASWQVIRRSATARTRFERIAGGQKERRKIALVAVGRWLLGCMHAMLRTGEVWRETVPAATCAAA